MFILRKLFDIFQYIYKSNIWGLNNSVFSLYMSEKYEKAQNLYKKTDQKILKIFSFELIIHLESWIKISEGSGNVHFLQDLSTQSVHGRLAFPIGIARYIIGS